MNQFVKGNLFEDYIEYIYRLLLDLEANKDDEPIIISRNVKLIRNGYTDEIDIYYEFTKAKIKHKVAIECKNQSTPLEIGKLRDFHSKIIRNQDLTGVVVSNSGFQSGAKNYADENGIILMETKDLPNFINLIGQRIKQIYLPNKYIKGEPFYILMEHINQVLTGSYHIVSFNNTPQSILLFLSKQHAQHYIDLNKEFDLTPRGLKIEAFDFLISFAERINAKFQIIVNKTNYDNQYLSVFLEPKELTNYK